METTDHDTEELEWRKVKAAILRIEQTTREINMKLSHVIETERDRPMLPEAPNRIP